MGILVPADLPLTVLKNDSERLVVEALCDQLTDGWFVIPSFVSVDDARKGGRDRETDIVLCHEAEGVCVLEVKGHVPKVQDGLWYAHGRPMEPQPHEQARNNAYALRERLRALPGLDRLEVEFGLVFPNVGQISGGLPNGFDQRQLLTSGALDDLRNAVQDLMLWRGRGRPIGREAVEAIVGHLCPDIDFVWDPEARVEHARRRLVQISGQHVRALERLDVNRRVVVTGAAGTGKTRLVLAWARRAAMRGERVLVTCYNEPLGGEINERLIDLDTVVAGPFFDIARHLTGMRELEVPEDADSRFWDQEAVGHLHTHWHRITDRFDTIIIDEAQDLSPAWIAQLAQLLDTAGPRRILMVADDDQRLYDRGFQLPTSDDGWARCELVYNCRNTAQIADLLRRNFGAAAPPGGGPESDIEWHEAADLDEVEEAVGTAIDRIIDADGHAPPRVLVATFSSKVRDLLRTKFAFVTWEHGEDATVICENVHRVKGLEFDHVVLVSGPDCKVTDQLLYVGISRAVVSLVVIGPPDLGQRLGLVTV
jgi:NAD(P)-dependent dehydrogenase (short-subunit alcohol dehydrogenase family)